MGIRRGATKVGHPSDGPVDLPDDATRTIFVVTTARPLASKIAGWTKVAKDIGTKEEESHAFVQKSEQNLGALACRILAFETGNGSASRVSGSQQEVGLSQMEGPPQLL